MVARKGRPIPIKAILAFVKRLSKHLMRLCTLLLGPTLICQILIHDLGTNESQASCFVVNYAFEIFASDGKRDRKWLFIINEIMPQTSIVVWAGLE